MTRLILTFHDSGAGALKGTGLADCLIPFGLNFVWGRLQSRSELDTLLSSRSATRGASTSRWPDNLTDECFAEARRHGLGLIEFCERFDAVELWVDPDPNAQLQMVWLLDYLRHYIKAALNIGLVRADVVIGNHPPEELVRWRLSTVKILNDHLETASAAWQAYRAPTPQDWFNLLSMDLSVLPQLRQTVLNCSKSFPPTRPDLARRKCGCWN